MKIIKPFYYDDFICIANKCKDSCCIGWKVDIDKTTFNKYKKIKGEFGKTLNKSISRSRSLETYLEYGKMKLEDRRCAFLNQEDLCNIYINLGEEYLCNTCKQYPREIHKYGDICERALVLSCPEVARLLISSNEPLSFNMEEKGLSELDKEYITSERYDSLLYNLLWEARSLFIETAQYTEIPLWKRLVFIRLSEEKFQDVINTKTYDKLNSLIISLRQIIKDEKYMGSLDNIQERNEIKTITTNWIIQSSINHGMNNDTFKQLIEELNVLLKVIENKQDFNKLASIEAEFDEYFKEKEYILENYTVYNLYNNCMKALKSKNLNKEILRLMISYTIIRKLLVARWSIKGGNLEQGDIVDVLYSFSRVLEHSESFIDNIYKEMKAEGYDTLANLTILIR